MVCSDFNDWAKCIIYENFNVNCMISISQKRQKLKRRKWLFFVVCFYHVTYVFQSESTLYSCLNVKELLAGNRRDIWNLSGCNGTRTHKHLVRKRILNHLAKLAKLSARLRTKWLWVRVPLQSCKINVCNPGKKFSADCFTTVSWFISL